METFNRAIRTYQQLVALQNMEILQAVAKEESHLKPQMFAKQSDSSQSKVFVNQCLMKFRKHFQYEDENVCDTLFTLACQCDCVGMLRFLMEQHKAEKRYVELGSYSKMFLPALCLQTIWSAFTFLLLPLMIMKRSRICFFFWFGKNDNDTVSSTESVENTQK